ncbi:hypothetical protein MTR67_007149 [Solanum verrucosum]|uniref:CSD domain-containing protein n=1 Tax=Solanum verrucosum TaxID=315347 RepID=A0AAF0TCU2_SOLVR|nr:hypothetical protein MTR67_007149 [Solanum verrucosum]
MEPRSVDLSLVNDGTLQGSLTTTWAILVLVLVGQSLSDLDIRPCSPPRAVVLMTGHRRGNRNKGTVKLFSDQKGLRFITPNDDGDDIFIYQSAIRSGGFRSLVDGEATEFDVEPGMLATLRWSMIPARWCSFQRRIP